MTNLNDIQDDEDLLSVSGCHLYRHFDASSRLLYVGISLSALHRLADHRAASHWFRQIVTVKIETFPTRSAALAAEARAILEETPLHNVRRPTRAEINTAAADSRNDLLRRVVSFDPVYNLKSAALVLGLTPSSVSRLIKAGELGSVRVGASVRITGWQMIEYLEHLGGKKP